MLRRMPLVVLALVALAVAVDAAIALRDAPRRAAAPAAPLPVGTALERSVPALALLDAQGRRTSLAAFKGRYVVLAPSLTLCHEACPLTTAALMQIQRAVRARGLGGRVVVAEASVDPWRDSPARLRAFRRRTGTDLTMLTGTRAEIRRLWRFFGVEYHRTPQDDPPDVDWWTHKPETFDVEHTDGLFIIDPAGRWRVYVPGMPDLGGRLPGRLRSLLNETGQKNLRHPDTPWAVTDALNDLWRLMRQPPERPGPAPKAPDAAQARAALAGSPHALAALHAQAGRLLGGGTAAVRARLAGLRGHLVVVNAWASWCSPCRSEFPLLADASARFGRRAAFLGLDVSDSDASARAFLARHHVSYPSYADPRGDAARSLSPFQGLPTTIFLDRRGRVVYVHTGVYKSWDALSQDIERLG